MTRSSARSARTAIAGVFTWDAENRLTSVGPYAGSEETNDVKVEFTYDYLGRRVSKTVSTYTGSAWQVSQKLKYIWHGWLMLVELEEDAQQDDDVMRKYTWGLDLVGQSGATGSLEGAGGILDTTSPRQAQGRRSAGRGRTANGRRPAEIRVHLRRQRQRRPGRGPRGGECGCVNQGQITSTAPTAAG